LHELLPGAARFAVLVNPNNPLAEPLSRDVQAAALSIGRQIEVLTASTNRDIDAVFAGLEQKRVDSAESPSRLLGGAAAATIHEHTGRKS
jgi:putative ABC transport system substrate-binding protein